MYRLFEMQERNGVDYYNFDYKIKYKNKDGEFVVVNGECRSKREEHARVEVMEKMFEILFKEAGLSFCETWEEWEKHGEEKKDWEL